MTVASLAAAGCSSDAVRFAENPFSNPFASNQRQAEPTYTGAIASAPSSSVSSAPLAPIGGAPAQQAAYTPQPTYPTSSTASYQPAGAVRMGGDRDWSLQGGTPITVGPTDSLNAVSSRYGVPASAIVATNNLSPTQPLTPGQKIVIPVFRRADGAQAQASVATPARVPAVTASAPPKAAGASHTVGSGDTLFSLSRTYGVSHREIAAANGLAPDAQLRMGQSVVIPGAARTNLAAKPAVTAPSTAPAAPSVATAFAPAPAAQVKAPQPALTTTPKQPVATVPAQAPAVADVQPVVARPDDTANMTAQDGKPDFRWPVRGRIISGYGSKPSGKNNDGINLAVPEGTPIRAAESGTVAYAGSELQGYGNLVLIRHAEGWVTAYAHASDIAVKKGDIVRRGQVIARAGRSGDVAAPQLHFEVRRGSSPVDPLDHLPRS